MTSPAPSALPSVPAFSDSVPAAALEVVLLARDQEAVVADLVAAVVGHLDAHMELPWILTVADHASCDHTFSAACASAATTNERKASARLAPTGGEVRAIRLDEQLDRRDLRARFADSEGAGGPGGGASPTDTLTFLRGTQLADAAGKVAFETAYPGWYQGRTVHIHVKVHVGGKQIHTGQLFFRRHVYRRRVRGEHAVFRAPGAPAAQRRRWHLRWRRRAVDPGRGQERLGLRGIARDGREADVGDAT